MISTTMNTSDYLIRGKARSQEEVLTHKRQITCAPNGSDRAGR